MSTIGAGASPARTSPHQKTSTGLGRGTWERAMSVRLSGDKATEIIAQAQRLIDMGPRWQSRDDVKTAKRALELAQAAVNDRRPVMLIGYTKDQQRQILAGLKNREKIPVYGASADTSYDELCDLKFMHRLGFVIISKQKRPRGE